MGTIPVDFLALVVAGLGAETLLRRTRAGWRLRAVGSNEYSTRRAGIPVEITFIGGYVACSLLTGIGAIMLMTQIGVGGADRA